MIASKSLIHISGPNRLQNELLSQYLEMETGLSCCSYSSDINNVPMDDKTMKRPRLLLLDCLGIEHLHMLNMFEIKSDSKQYESPIALFNVVRDRRFEEEALKRAVRGVLYADEPLTTFAKGIKAVLNGEIWYPGKILAKFLCKQRSIAGLPKDTLPFLTSRERQILTKIASGASNKEIAADLCVSIHTVKTHVSNIFKKINVSSRLRAAQFVARYF